MNISRNDIKKIMTKEELAAVFSTSAEQLDYYISSKEDIIKRGVLFKNNGQVRQIVMVKNDSFKHFLQELEEFLYLSYSSFMLPKSVHGFIKGKSIITNAQQHTQKKLVLNVDVKNFFRSITAKHVRDSFVSLGFNTEMSQILTNIVCVDGSLPIGFPTSPVISNIVCLTIDHVLERLSQEYNATYTRYADDMTFSSDVKIPSREQIEKILETLEFKINPNKYRLYRKGGPQYVTGLTVVSDKPRLSRRFKHSLRLELYYIKKYGFIEHFIKSFERALKRNSLPSKFSRIAFASYGLNGFLSFIHSVEPKLAKKARSVFSRQTNSEKTTA